jgi:Na+/proline symporter
VIISIIFITDSAPAGAGELFSRLVNEGKLQVFNSGFGGGIKEFFNTPYTLIAGITGGAFLSMASHGTDQLIIQRLLSAGSLKKSQKALLLTGVVIVIQFALFLTLGALLYDYFGGKQFARSDEIFPLFILNELPSGVSGLLIAGMFAAALSTLAGSISSMASSTMFDLILTGKRGRELSEEKKLKYSRILTLVWALVLIQSAALFMNSDRAVVEIALSIASFTYGGLLGTFLLGVFVKNARQEDALAAFTAGILVMVSVILLKLVAWTWFTLIGVAVTMLTGYLLSVLTDQRNE